MASTLRLIAIGAATFGVAAGLLVLRVRAGDAAQLTWAAVRTLVRARFPDVRQIEPGALAAWLADPGRTQPLLLDARTPAEFAVSHLSRARRVDPDRDPVPPLEGEPRDRPIVVYCAVGYRSARVADRLQRSGFRDVSNLEGSIFAWANAGRPVERDGQPVREVHPYDGRWGVLLDPDLHPKIAP